MGVGFNIPHMVQTYQLVDTKTDLPIYYVWVMVGVIDFAILVLAINEDKSKRLGSVPTVTFAWVIFILNLYLYWIKPIEANVFSTFEFIEYVKLIPGLLYAAIPAYIIYYFSEMISDQFRDSFKTDREELEIIRNEIAVIRPDLEKFRPSFDSISIYKDEKITIGGSKAMICKCNRLVKAGSNRATSGVCSCGELIEW